MATDFNDPFGTQAFGMLEKLAGVGLEDQLQQAAVIAQIDED